MFLTTHQLVNPFQDLDEAVEYQSKPVPRYLDNAVFVLFFIYSRVSCLRSNPTGQLTSEQKILHTFILYTLNFK